jgi:predicted Zn-dependent protease
MRIPPRLLIAGVIAVIAVVGYFAKTSTNPITGKKQHISLSPQQEVAIGLQSAPEMIRQMGGEHPDPKAQQLVDAVGAKLVGVLPPEATPYPYEFHLLADSQTVNAFALPGGQVFITAALLSRLETEGQLAGVLGHEIGHVIGRHSAERMAKMELTQGLVQAVGVASSDSAQGQQSAAQIAAMVGNMINLKYGREDELESDKLGLRFMADAGYDPRSMIGVMEILEKASGGGSQPEFASTHPNPGNRVERIKEHLAQMFPQGVPEGLQK